MRTIVMATLLIALSGLAGCASLDTHQGFGEAVGIPAGALIGGILGNQVGNPRTGAAIGAFIGAALGATWGSELDRQEQAFKARLWEEQRQQHIALLRSRKTLTVALRARTYFQPNSSKITDDGLRTLNRIAGILNRYPNSQVAVTGYADGTGSMRRNLSLSRQRARMVAAYLMLLGVDPGRMVVGGLGSQNPVASNLEPGGRQLNRRVEIAIQPTA